MEKGLCVVEMRGIMKAWGSWIGWRTRREGLWEGEWKSIREKLCFDSFWLDFYFFKTPGPDLRRGLKHGDTSPYPFFLLNINNIKFIQKIKIKKKGKR